MENYARVTGCLDKMIRNDWVENAAAGDMRIKINFCKTSDNRGACVGDGGNGTGLSSHSNSKNAIDKENSQEIF